MHAEVLASSYTHFLAKKDPPPILANSKGGKGKGKGRYDMPSGNQRSTWPPPKSEVTNYDHLMLPHPDMVNWDEGTYVIQGPLAVKTRVTNENWATLRFNTKMMSPEYFPSSYLSPVPTVATEGGDVSKATFSRSTITGTLDDFRALLLAPPLSKKSKVPPDVYRALSLNIASEAFRSTDKATAPKRILAFFRLCALYIPCEFEDYEDAVRSLDSEMDSNLLTARLVLEMVQEQKLPAILKAQNEAVSGGLCSPTGSVLPATWARTVPHGEL